MAVHTLYPLQLIDADDDSDSERRDIDFRGRQGQHYPIRHFPSVTNYVIRNSLPVLTVIGKNEILLVQTIGLPSPRKYQSGSQVVRSSRVTYSSRHDVRYSDVCHRPIENPGYGNRQHAGARFTRSKKRTQLSHPTRTASDHGGGRTGGSFRWNQHRVVTQEHQHALASA